MASGPITSMQIDGVTESHFLGMLIRSLVDKNSRSQGDRGLEFSRRKKGQTPPLPYIPQDYVSYLRTVSGLNLLANPVILKCKLWDRSGLYQPLASLVAQRIKRLAAMQVDLGSNPASGRSSGEGNGNPFQYLCRENPMDGGARQATVHGVTKSLTLSDFTFPFWSLQGLYNSNVSCLKTVSGLNLLANSVILKCKLWEQVW